MSLLKAIERREGRKALHSVLEGPARKCPGQWALENVRRRAVPYGVQIGFQDYRDGSRVYEVFDGQGSERFISQDWPNVVESVDQLVSEEVFASRRRPVDQLPVRRTGHRAVEGEGRDRVFRNLGMLNAAIKEEMVPPTVRLILIAKKTYRFAYTGTTRILAGPVVQGYLHDHTLGQWLDMIEQRLKKEREL